MHKILFISLVLFLFMSCSKIVDGNNIKKIIISEKNHEYIGTVLRSVEITDPKVIKDIFLKINDCQKDIIKFAGKYYVEIDFNNGDQILLRTDGSLFEVIKGIKNMRYFKIKNGFDFKEYFIN